VCSALNLFGLWVGRVCDYGEWTAKSNEQKCQERKRIHQIALVIVRGRTDPSCG
jgi:hypothetical protein